FGIANVAAYLNAAPAVLGTGLLPIRSRHRIAFSTPASTASAWEKSSSAERFSSGPFGGFILYSRPLSRFRLAAVNGGWSPLPENIGAITAARESLLFIGGTPSSVSIVCTMFTVV